MFSVLLFLSLKAWDPSDAKTILSPHFYIEESPLTSVPHLWQNFTFGLNKLQNTGHRDLILPRFDIREPTYPPDGLKHFTQEKDCQYEACI